MMQDETKAMLKKICEVIDHQREHCDRRMKATQDVHTREIWACCALTCDCLQSGIETQLDVAEQREAAQAHNQRLAERERRDTGGSIQ
jgi:cell division protein FtsB